MAISGMDGVALHEYSHAKKLTHSNVLSQIASVMKQEDKLMLHNILQIRFPLSSSRNCYKHKT